MESASSSSLPNPKPQSIYDVFISFRGEDIRRKFVCHLYQALSKIAGVDTFLDVENLDKGMRLKELLRAIEGSQIAIVVFSENYTDSTWCLRELEQIIVCHETRGQRVVPVFYEVDPSHVSQQKGDFGRALKADAQKRYLGEDLEYVLSRWNRVLTKATNFSGWDVSNYRNDAELVEQIMNFVLTKRDYVLSITKFPIGLESHVKKVIGFIGNHSSKVGIIGIWGMGGLGKTTLAKAIYNRIHYSFVDKSFIQDIREVCKMGDEGYVHLQEQLLSDILKTKVKIESVEMGKSMIKNKFAGKRALIVLDDLNEFDQLESLCENTLWIGKGSVVIITTRNLHLLTTIKVDYLYKMKEMEQNESLELFCGHAFGGAKPREEFSELIKDAIAYCGGLPLALEVLGSYLRGRSPREWRSVLAKLEVIPNANVQEILRISFDGLCHQMERDIFLDICCFFIGKDRNYVKEILNGCGVIDADRGITTLIESSLIKIKKNNKLEMHDLLRDMGREIIRESSTMEPGKRSRLWFHKEVLEVLTKKTGLAFGESCAVILPGDNYPYWIGQTGEGRSVSFTVPKDGRIKGMVLCVVYLSTLENIATECLISVLILNYTKCTIQIFKGDAVISSDDAIWQGILSHLGAGDKVEILLVFGHRLVVKKTAVYLMYGEPSEKGIEPPRKPPIEKVYSRKRKMVRISIDIEIESVSKLSVKVYSRKRMNGSNKNK